MGKFNDEGMNLGFLGSLNNHISDSGFFWHLDLQVRDLPTVD
jgi:hypothetical protein